MTNDATDSAIAACVIKPIDAMACERYFAWLLGEPQAAPAEDATNLVWALAHCDDGVTWGRYDQAQATWHFASAVEPDVSPPLRRETLQELRIFGEPGEILIWRSDAALHGRVLRDTEPPPDQLDESDPLRPDDESRILRGDLVPTAYENGFSRIADRGTGSEQVLPAVVTPDGLRARRARLGVRHYFQQDTESGTVRIAVTRLVNLTIEETR
jgi:CRISPR-associated protein (TIGR03984 family)